LFLNDVEKRVNLVFVVTAFSDWWLRESHVVDLLWSEGAGLAGSARLSQQTFQLGDALLGVVLVHQQMVPPGSSGYRKSRTPF
jgi:hypothetical protein